jgi:putative ABC transport system permease protein
MRLGTLLHFYRVRLRARIVTEMLAVVGISVGVALVFAALVASTSLTGSVRELTDGLVGASNLQLAARGPDGFDQRLLKRVQLIDGVKGVAPIAEVRVGLAGPAGRSSAVLFGADPRFARFGGSLLQRPALKRRNSKTGLALPTGLADDLGLLPGRSFRVETGSGSISARFSGALDSSEIGLLSESPVALGSLALVQRLAGMDGRISRVFVQSDPDRTAAVERGLQKIAAGRLTVAPADREVALFERVAYPTNESTALFSALSALVGFLFALSAVLLTVPQRRRLIADLRLAGYEPWLVVRLLLFDALVLGAFGGAFGLVLGEQAAEHLFNSVPGYLSSAFPVGSQRIVTFQSVAAAVGAGMVAAIAAVFLPVHAVLSSRPVGLGALAGAPRRLRSTATGLLLLIVAIAIIALVPRVALLGLIALTVSMLLLLPTLLAGWAAAIERGARLTRRPAVRLAEFGLRSGAARTRMTALAATGAIAVFATVSIGGAHADLQRGLDAVAVDVDQGVNVWVTLRGSADIFAATPFEFPPQQLRALKRLPGVTQVRLGRGAFLDLDNYRVWVMAPPRSAVAPMVADQLREGTVGEVDRRFRSGGALVLSQGLASHLGVGVGDRLWLLAPIPRSFTVAGLSTNMGWPGGAIVIDAASFARAWGTREPSVLRIQTGPGESSAQAVREVRRSLGPHPPFVVETRRERINRQKALSRAGLARLGQISLIVVIGAILAMGVVMGGVIWQRRPTLAALKVQGFGEFELWGSLILESGLLLGAGCLVGAGFGLVGQVLLDRALEAITGFPVVYQMAVSIVVRTLALVTGIAAGMLAIPGWFAARVRPLPGLDD